MNHILTISHAALPPSENSIYKIVRKGSFSAIGPTDKAKDFKLSAIADITRNYGSRLGVLEPRGYYAVVVTYIIPYTTFWVKKWGGEEEDALRKLDTTNRNKLSMDVLMSCVGVDDHRFIDPLARKRAMHGYEGVIWSIYSIPKELLVVTTLNHLLNPPDYIDPFGEEAKLLGGR